MAMRRYIPVLVLLGATTACSAPDPAELAKTDTAFQGQMVDGVLRPVAVRPVKVGMGGRTIAACAGQAMVKDGIAGGGAPVHWSASADGPEKARITGEVAVCEEDGAWRGIVFPAAGQSLSGCDVRRGLRSVTEYQGPCRSGWVEAKALSAAQ